MTMIKALIGLDPVTGQPRYDYRHPFLAGARRQGEIRLPETYTTSKTKRSVAAFRIIPREATLRGGYSARAHKEKQDRANR